LTEDSDSAPQANQRVRAFLEDFITLKNTPNSAVLINGPWGSGKTFLIKNFIKEHQDQHHFYYVSLYGVTTREGFSDAVFFAAYPALDNKVVKITGSLLSSVLKFKGVDSNITLKTVIEKTETGVYVFDDLERSGIPICDLLGYINEFVEHAGCRVIILANEHELTTLGGDNAASEYQRRKEKTIGWTLAVQCDVEAGLEAFLERVSSVETRKVLADAQNELLHAFQKSESENLRLLQQAIWDFERAIPKVKKEYQDKAAFKTFIGITAALAIEAKRGAITRSDLKDPGKFTSARILAKNDDERSKAPIEQFSARHPEISLYDPVVSNEIVHHWLFDGQIDENVFNRVFEDDSRFVDVSEVPSWKIAWDWPRNSHDKVMQAVQDMNDRISRFEYRLEGEILHVFGILIDFAQRKFIDETTGEALDRGKHYIDELLQQGFLKADNEAFGRGAGSRSYEGLGFSGENLGEFNELCSHMRESLAQAAVIWAEGQIPNLLDLMENEPVEFVRRLCPTTTKSDALCKIPILAKISPSDFGQKFLTLHPSTMLEIANVFSLRYEFAHNSNDLHDEKNWLIAVKTIIEQAAASAPPVKSRQLGFVIDHTNKGIKRLSREKAPEEAKGDPR